ncbi:toll/interleukin-1 receptor domain-containing protein [Oerskovia merdavium]|uniref:toll/interleukin-1 receptor domain-containing protein n=1 Tax=Oerskovia merdavium TaxID=2762227 RepID=UPI0038505A17
MLMSKASMESGWVEAEWMARYWDEVSDRKVRIIPVLLEDCGIPTLLRGKKYADFRSDYSLGIEEVFRAVR